MLKTEMLAKVEKATADFHRGLTTFDEYLFRIKDIALAHLLDEVTGEAL